MFQFLIRTTDTLMRASWRIEKFMAFFFSRRVPTVLIFLLAFIPFPVTLGKYECQR